MAIPNRDKKRNADKDLEPRRSISAKRLTRRVLMDGEAGAKREFEKLVRGLRAEHRPLTITEDQLIVKMVNALWQSRRLDAIFKHEKGFYSGRGCDLKAKALHAREVAAADRAFYRALSALKKQKWERKQQSNQKNGTKNTEQPQSSTPAQHSPNTIQEPKLEGKTE